MTRSGTARASRADDFLQHEVARFVTEGVVDFLEAVEVDQHDCDLAGLLAVDGAMSVAESLLEQDAVREIGQAVMQCVVSEPINQTGVLQRDARLRSDRGEESPVLVVEGRDVAESIRHAQQPDEALVDDEGADDAVSLSALREVRPDARALGWPRAHTTGPVRVEQSGE